MSFQCADLSGWQWPTIHSSDWQCPVLLLLLLSLAGLARIPPQAGWGTQNGWSLARCRIFTLSGVWTSDSPYLLNWQTVKASCSTSFRKVSNVPVLSQSGLLTLYFHLEVNDAFFCFGSVCRFCEPDCSLLLCTMNECMFICLFRICFYCMWISRGLLSLAVKACGNLNTELSKVSSAGGAEDVHKLKSPHQLASAADEALFSLLAQFHLFSSCHNWITLFFFSFFLKSFSVATSIRCMLKGTCQKCWPRAWVVLVWFLWPLYVNWATLAWILILLHIFTRCLRRLSFTQVVLR